MNLMDLFTPAQIEALENRGLMTQALRCLINTIHELELVTDITESLLENNDD